MTMEEFWKKFASKRKVSSLTIEDWVFAVNQLRSDMWAMEDRLEKERFVAQTDREEKAFLEGAMQTRELMLSTISLLSQNSGHRMEDFGQMLHTVLSRLAPPQRKRR